MSESKTSNVLERSSGRIKKVVIAVPKTSNVLERLNVSMSTGAIQEKGTYTHSSGRTKKVRSEGTE